MTIRLPDDTHERLRDLAQRRNVSLNRLMEELLTQALAESDAETRFRARSVKGDSEEALRLLDSIDAVK
jgi:predicted transcriptional regulator